MWRWRRWTLGCNRHIKESDEVDGGDGHTAGDHGFHSVVRLGLAMAGFRIWQSTIFPICSLRQRLRSDLLLQSNRISVVAVISGPFLTGCLPGPYQDRLPDNRDAGSGHG